MEPSWLPIQQDWRGGWGSTRNPPYLINWKKEGRGSMHWRCIHTNAHTYDLCIDTLPSIAPFRQASSLLYLFSVMIKLRLSAVSFLIPKWELIHGRLHELVSWWMFHYSGLCSGCGETVDVFMTGKHWFMLSDRLIWLTRLHLLTGSVYTLSLNHSLMPL